MRTWKRFLYWLKTYWTNLLLFSVLSVLAISIVFAVVSGYRAWNESEPYIRQSQIAIIPLQLFMQLVMAFTLGVVNTFLWYWLIIKKGTTAMTQTQKEAVSGKKVGIRWDDVIGMDEAKEEAMEVVSLMKDRAEVKRIGGKILKGLLLLGPPGCGKTYLAKAIATEAQLPFMSMSGSEFVEMFVGVGAGRIRSLFEKARRLSELEGGCIIFIDEMDAVGAQRGLETGFGGTSEHNQTLNQLLVEMDGLKDEDSNVVVIGATNAPQGFLDPALLRPGRFDRKIYVDKPNLEDREKIFSFYLKGVAYDPASVTIDRLARITVGHSPADIANIVREAALIAVRREQARVSMKDIDDARERITLGIKRRIRLREEDKWQIAYHEAGHAIVTYLMVPTQDVFKITVTPRGSTGGVTWTPEREEIFVRDRNNLMNKIKVCLGSYAAERAKFGFTTAGVDMDFQEALYIAHNMVWRWGMGNSGLIGNFHVLTNGSGGGVPISEQTRQRLDQDAQEILQVCMKDVDGLIGQERAILDRLAQELVSKDELNYDEIQAIFESFGKGRAQ